MGFKVALHCGGETCDRCKKPMTEECPGITITITSRSYHERQSLWLHIKCAQWNVLNKANRMLREWREKQKLDAAQKS